MDLKAKAQKESRLTDELIQLYVLEGFLARLAMSAHADKLVLKGGVLLTAFDTRRPTRDIDFAARDLANDIECILDVARAILAVTQKDDDGLVFDPRSAVAEVIRDEEEYSGVRVSMNAELATARVRFHLDVNVGDPVWPAPSRVSMPRPLGGQPLEPMGYPLHMVHAEKTVADLACIDAGGSREQRIGQWFRGGVPLSAEVVHSVMPTTRPRHQVTETDELAAALDEAAVRWPGLSRGQLITRLALEGHQAVVVRQRRHRSARLEALRRHSGALTDVYPQGDLEALREDWPE